MATVVVIQTLKQSGGGGPTALLTAQGLDGSGRPEALLLAVNPLLPAHFPRGLVGWAVGRGQVSDIFQLHTPLALVSRPGEACCLSSVPPCRPLTTSENPAGGL